MTKKYVVMIGDMYVEKFWEIKNSISIMLGANREEALEFDKNKIEKVLYELESKSMNPTVIEVTVIKDEKVLGSLEGLELK